MSITYPGGSGTPGGSDTQVQYNNANAFGGISNGTAGQVLTSNGANVVPSFQAAGGAGALQTATVTLDATQLIALNVTTVPIVASPGLGKLLLPVSACYQYKAGSTPFTAGSGFILIGYGAGDISIFQLNGPSQSGFVDQAVDQISLASFNGNINTSNGPTNVELRSNLEDEELAITTGGGTAMSGGDGTLTVTVYYTVVTLQ